MDKFRKPHGHVRPGGLSASSFNIQSPGGDRGGFGKPSFKSGLKPSFDRPRFGSRPEQRGGFNKEKFDAICSHCGKSCQVPFRPNGKKPVFCSACFNSPRGTSAAPANSIRPIGERGSTEFSRTNVSRDRAPTPQHTNKLENVGMSFSPHSSHRNDSRELANVPPVEDRRTDDIKRKLDSMDSKLESILRAMTTKTEEIIKPAEIIKSADERRRGGAEPTSGERAEPKKKAITRKK